MMSQIIFTLFFATLGFAQTETGPAPATATAEEKKEVAPPTEPKVEKILVTGSYIKRIDEEGPSAVVVLKKEQLEKTGHNSVADVLRDTAVVTAVGREASGSAGAGVSTASIRGFGSDSILVLLNGLRLPKFGGGNSVDLNLIPIAALERVEILKDGASALYGSDAVGGVINFITKKDYNQSDIAIDYSLPEEIGGNRMNIAASSGIKKDKYSLMGVLQYRNNTGIKDKDRNYSKQKDFFTESSPTGSPGTWVDVATGTKHPAANCPAGQINERGYCGFDTTLYSTGLPDLEQYSALLSGEYKLTENLKFSSTTTFTHKKVFWAYAPGPDNFLIDNATATSWGLTPAPTNGARVYYRLTDLGSRNNDNVTDALTTQASLEGKFTPTWDWNLSAVYGRSRMDQDGTSGYANKTILKSLYGTTFNPFRLDGLANDVSSAAVNPNQNITNTQSSVRFVTTTQIYSGGNYFGPIGMAAGLSSDWQDYRERVDAVTAGREADGSSTLFGGSGSNGSGKRNSQAAFTEFSLFPVDSVEVGLAARYDHFSDFGNTVNPKVSVSWQLSKQFLIKSSAGTGFRAPDLGSLYGGESFGFPAFIDRKACSEGKVGTCQANQYNFRSRGNPDLKEERSIFYNLGFVAQPKKNWNISVDGWMAQIKDQVGLDLTEVTIAEQRLGAAALEQQYGIIVKRDANGELDYIDGLERNLGKSTLAGMDISVQNQAKINVRGIPINVLTGIDHTQFFPSSTEFFPGNGVKKNRNNFWKNSTYISFNHNYSTLRVTARSIAGGDKSANDGEFGVVGYGSLPAYTEYDLDFTYARFYGGTMAVGIRNVFGFDRPLDDTTGAPNDRLDTSYYDPIGRAVHASYSRSF